MTAVNVTTQNSTVTVTDSSSSTVVTVPSETSVIASTIGVQGPQGPQGPPGLGFDIDTTAKVDKSVVYYSSSSGKFLADDTWTINTLVIGGNF